GAHRADPALLPGGRHRRHAQGRGHYRDLRILQHPLRIRRRGFRAARLGMSQNGEPEPNPFSPCLGICLMDPATRMCRGCLRTIDEIRTWYEASAAEKRAILARLDERRRGMD